MRKTALILSIGLLFLALTGCKITGRATPTPRPFLLTVAPTPTEVAGGSSGLPTPPPLETTLPPPPLGTLAVPLTVPPLPTGLVTLPTVPAGLVPAVGTLLPGLLSTPTPTATPTATR